MNTRATVLALIILAWTSAHAQAPSPAPLRIVAFPSVTTLPIRAAETQGFFARRGLTLQVEITPNSQLLRDGLAAGRYDVAHAAVDNAIAMTGPGGTDVAIVMGGDDSMNQLVVQQHITTVADLRGTTVAVDAPNTAYALQLKKILALGGLVAGRDYTMKPVGGTPQRLKAMQEDRALSASMLNPPSSIMAARGGLRLLGSAGALLGRYQGMGAFVRRDWAQGHRDSLERYLAAFIEGLRWLQAPQHTEQVLVLLSRELQIPPDVAAETYERTIAAGSLARDAKLDVDGLRSVLALRAEMEHQWNGQPPSPDGYYDEQFYKAALASLDRH